MKVAVIGSRSISGIDIAKYIPPGTTEIISGGARGVDTLAAEYAKRNNIKTQIFLPDYNKYGKTAPLIRNYLIIDNADLIIAIWNGVSRGTIHAVKYARKQQKDVKLYLK